MISPMKLSTFDFMSRGYLDWVKAVIVTLLFASVGLPATAGLLDQVPVDSAILRGDYKNLASCAYVALDASQGAGIKKIDLPKESRLALESGGVRHWQLVFSAGAPGTTRVEFSQVQTMWGTLGGKDIMPVVRQCAAR